MSKSFGKNFGKAKSGKSGGLKVFWLPTGHKSHKHKKNKYYVQNDSPKSAMMSGDSPNSHKDFFDFKEGRSTPPPTTSKDTAVQSGSGITDPKTDVVTASVLVEPPKEHGPGTNYTGTIDGHHSDKNDDEILATEDRPLKADDRPDGGDKHDKSAPKKLNGTIDKLDGNWIPEMKKEDEEQDDSCGVKCLYYTLQCCECTIM